MSVLDTPGAEELRAEFLSSSPSSGDRLTALAVAGVVITACVFGAVHAHGSWHGLLLAIFLIGLYILGFKTEFRAAAGAFVVTQPVLVAMIFALPWGWAPIAVVVAVLLGSMLDGRPRFGLHSYAIHVGNGFHSLGPFFVLEAFHVHAPNDVPLPVLVLALLAQFALDGSLALMRGAFQGVTPRMMAKPLLWTFSIDALLAPIGFCIVVTAQDRPAAYLLLASPIILIRLMQADRESHRKQAEQIRTAYTEVREQASMDPLTGLHNRRGWGEAMARAEAEVNQPGRRSAIVIIADVDHLKPTNDTYGHEVGDLLLQEVGHVMAGLGPEGSMVARLGGDEFGVLFTVPAGYLLPDFVANARRAMEQSSLQLGHLVSASIGVAVCPPGGVVDDAVRRADHAAAIDKAERRVNRLSMTP